MGKFQLNKIVEIKFGSHLYGTDTENSDLDLKGIYLPDARDILLGTYKKTISTTRPKQPFERNNKDDVDIEIFSIDRYLKLLAEGQTVALDILFAPKESYTFQTHSTVFLEQIFKSRDKILHKNINAFVGYARQQAAKYGVKGFRVAALRETLKWLSFYNDNQKIYEIGHDAIYRWITEIGNDHIKLIDIANKAQKEVVETHLEVCNRKVPFHATVKYAKQVYQRIFDMYGQRALMAEKNEGIDWKALSHAVRVNCEAQELLTTNFITFPRPEKELLLKIKKGQMDYEDVAIIIENGLATLEESHKNSILREAPDMKWIDNYIYELYREIVHRS